MPENPILAALICGRVDDLPSGDFHLCPINEITVDRTTTPDAFPRVELVLFLKVLRGAFQHVNSVTLHHTDARNQTATLFEESFPTRTDDLVDEGVYRFRIPVNNGYHFFDLDFGGKIVVRIPLHVRYADE